MTPEQLQVRCLEETHVVEVSPPLQIVYLGNGCEGYSPSMFLPAKTEITIQIQLEDRKDYFLQLNFVFTPDQYIGVWWQVRTRLMNKDQAKALVAQVEPLGTIDYTLIKRQVPTINTDYGLSLPVLPTTLVVGGLILLLMIGGIVLGCYVY